MYLLTDTYRILTKRLYIHVTFACGNFIGRFTKPLRAPDSQCTPGTSRERKIWNIDSSLRNLSGIHYLSHYSIQQSNFQDHTHLCTHARTRRKHRGSAFQYNWLRGVCTRTFVRCHSASGPAVHTCRRRGCALVSRAELRLGSLASAPAAELGVGSWARGETMRPGSGEGRDVRQTYSPLPCGVQTSAGPAAGPAAWLCGSSSQDARPFQNLRFAF